MSGAIARIDAPEWVAEQRKALRKIAQGTLGLDERGLEALGNDRFDFVDLHVDAIRKALEAAYAAGYVSGRADAEGTVQP